MADLLIRIRDKESSGDPETDAVQFKRGDVIAVWPTPGPWGTEELRNPDWRIVRLPNVSVEDAQELMAPERLATLDGERLMRKRRARLDVDNLPAPVRAWLADDTRAVPIFSSPLPRAAFVALVLGKPARQPFRVL